MQHYYSFEEVGNSQALQGVWATIGTFDGVHLGHQAILKPLVTSAHAAGAPAAVITFHPHPMVVLRGIGNNLYLNSPDERAQLLGKVGVDAVITLTFDRALAELSAEEFMGRVKRNLDLHQLWVGSDFALGRNRQGDIPTLVKLGKKLGYHLHVIDEVNETDAGGRRISSSHIRELLREGQVDRAAQLLGRPYAIKGTVVHGDGRGRGLGFPTANIDYWPGKLIPPGIYATWAWIGERRVDSVTSIGVRPTFDHSTKIPTVESYLLDFDENLYGQTLRIEFHTFLRPELRFDSVQSLIHQMGLDTQKAREVLSNAA